MSELVYRVVVDRWPDGHTPSGTWTRRRYFDRHAANECAAKLAAHGADVHTERGRINGWEKR